MEPVPQTLCLLEMAAVVAKAGPMNARIWVDESHEPGRVAEEIQRVLAARRMNHKFLYDSVRQAEKWLALHEAHSPARKDEGCVEIYDQAFQETARRWRHTRAMVVGIGCGGGHKEVGMGGALAGHGVETSFVAADVSLPLVLAAKNRFEAASKDCHRLKFCEGWVLDFQAATAVTSNLAKIAGVSTPRLITFFGMLPNFEPEEVLPKLSALLRVGDRLLLSANLAPGPNYRAGVRRVLPLYDNIETRDWLESAFWGLGFDLRSGRTVFGIRPGTVDRSLLRIHADFVFSNEWQIPFQGQIHSYRPGQRFQLFYSYRHTPETLARTLASHQLQIETSWLALSGEEGVFLVKRNRY